MYSEETVRRIEELYERQIVELRRNKTTVVRVERVTTGYTEVMQILDIIETMDGLYIRVC